MTVVLPENTSTDLVSTTDRATALAELAVGKLSLNDVLTQLVSLTPEPKPTVALAKMPNPVKVPEALKKAMADLDEVYGRVNPATRRELRSFEYENLREEADVLAIIAKAVKDREAAIKEIMATSLDVDLEKRGIVNEHTERDEKGHYRVAFPGTREEKPAGDGKIWVREGTEDQNTLDPQLLEIQYQTGEISEEVYNQVTETVTVFSQDRYKAMLLNPKTHEAAIDLAKKIGKVKKGYTKIQVRKIPAKTTVTVI